MQVSSTNYKKLVGLQVKKFRRGQNITQSDLAEHCGIYRTYLSRIESGIANPTLVTLVALADAMKVSPHTLLQSEPEALA